MKSEKEPRLDDVVAQVAQVTQSLLEKGAEPSQVALALTSVAADISRSISSFVIIPFPMARRLRAENTAQIVHPHISNECERMRKEAHKRRVLAFLEAQIRKQTGEAQI